MYRASSHALPAPADQERSAPATGEHLTATRDLQTSEARPPEGDRESPPADGRSKTVRCVEDTDAKGERPYAVVVDDDEAQRRLMVQALRFRGHACSAFSSVAAAVRAIAAAPPRVVVVDLVMPSEGGLDLCRRLVETLGIHAPPVVVVSGVGDFDPIREVLDAGATHFVRKPFSVGEFVAIVERAARGPVAHAATSPDARPDRLGEFEIVRSLGSGGMGRTYVARSVRTQIEAVLKVLDPAAGFLDEHLRFHREYEVLASLCHPGLPRVFGCGTEHGLTYIVMELVRGEPLDARLRRAGPLAPSEALEIATYLAASLAYVHEQGIVHRDVKPSNVILGVDGHPVLVDFGLARRGRDLAVTARFEILGTPAYCAPELAFNAPATPRSDVFALGLTLYECLLGFHPVTARIPGLEPLQVLLHFAREGVPDLRELLPGAPASLAGALASAVSREPEERPDAATFLRDLERARSSLRP